MVLGFVLDRPGEYVSRWRESTTDVIMREGLELDIQFIIDRIVTVTVTVDMDECDLGTKLNEEDLICWAELDNENWLRVC